MLTIQPDPMSVKKESVLIFGSFVFVIDEFFKYVRISEFFFRLLNDFIAGM